MFQKLNLLLVKFYYLTLLIKEISIIKTTNICDYKRVCDNCAIDEINQTEVQWSFGIFNNTNYIHKNTNFLPF